MMYNHYLDDGIPDEMREEVYRKAERREWIKWMLLFHGTAFTLGGMIAILLVLLTKLL